MKTKYNNYLSLINESFLLNNENILFNFLKKYFKKFKDIKVIKKKVNEVDSILSSNYYIFKNYTLFVIEYNNIDIVSFYYKDKKYYINISFGLYNCENIKDLSLKIDSILNIYYDEFYKKLVYTNKIISFNNIPIFDIDKYSHLIYRILLTDKIYFKQLNDIFNNLNDEYKEKIKILNNANNFDLL